ncbi:MAG: hypothetical protein WBF51_01635 [Candidatus Dormiibacterota bacterium]
MGNLVVPPLGGGVGDPPLGCGVGVPPPAGGVADSRLGCKVVVPPLALVSLSLGLRIAGTLGPDPAFGWWVGFAVALGDAGVDWVAAAPA